MKSSDLLQQLQKEYSTEDQVLSSHSVDESFVFSGIQDHMIGIHKLLFSSNIIIKKETLQLHAVLLRQGLINPLKCVSTFLAMQVQNVTFCNLPFVYGKDKRLFIRNQYCIT